MKTSFSKNCNEYFKHVIFCLFKKSVGPEKDRCFEVSLSQRSSKCLTSESVESAALTLEGIDDIHGSDSLPLGVFSVGDRITDDVLKEDLEDTSGLLIDEARDTLDTSTASQSADGGLGDTLDVITQYFAMALGASFAESFASFSSSSHDVFFLIVQLRMMHLEMWKLIGQLINYTTQRISHLKQNCSLGMLEV